jgi:mediator of RNA polymerase II transcription subunit 18
MHELFLISHLSDDEVQRALRIFQGYCGMSPVTLLRRRMTFEGPRLKQLKGIEPTFIKDQERGKQHLWRSLHDQITRQSYVITLIFDINKDHFGQPEVSESRRHPLCRALPVKGYLWL